MSLTGSYFDRDIVYEWDNTLYENWRTAYYGPFYGLYDTDYVGSTTFNDQKQNRWAYEVRLTSQGESRFQWMAGAFYEDIYDWWHYGAEVPGLTSTTAWATAQSYAYYYGYDTHYPLADTDIYYSNRFEKSVRPKAVFGELSYDLTEKWTVTGGARWFEFDRQEVESFEVPLGLPVFDRANNVFFLAEPTVSAGKDDDVVFKFATQYHFDDDRMLYALYSEGFRLGGRNSARAAQAGTIPLDYEPDKMENYEAGLKSQWHDDRLQVNVSLFFMEWTDIQLSDDPSEDDPFWVRGYFNGGTAEQKGIELDTKWRVSDRFSLEVGGFVADPEFSEETLEPDGDLIGEGWPMPDSPKQKFWAAAEFRVPGLLIRDGEFWTRLSYSYQSEFWNSLTAIRCVNTFQIANNCDDPDDPSDPDDLVDARDQLVPSWSTSTLQFGVSSTKGWDAALVIRNLFDENKGGWLSSLDYGEFFGDSRFPSDPRRSGREASASRSPSDGDRRGHGLSPCL